MARSASFFSPYLFYTYLLDSAYPDPLGFPM
jgi:hypothetical protein